MRKPFESYDDCDIPPFSLATPPAPLPELSPPDLEPCRCCQPILNPNIPGPYGLVSCPEVDELVVTGGSPYNAACDSLPLFKAKLVPRPIGPEDSAECVYEFEVSDVNIPVYCPEFEMATGDDAFKIVWDNEATESLVLDITPADCEESAGGCSLRISGTLTLPIPGCPEFSEPESGDFEISVGESDEDKQFEVTIEPDAEDDECKFKVTGKIVLPPYPCGLEDAAFSNADIQYTDGDPSFDFEAVEAAECTFRAIIRLPSPGCPEFGEPETDDFEAMFDESIDTPEFSVSISPNDDPEGEGCNFKVTGELKLPPYPDGSTVDCIQPFKLIGPLGNENEAIVDVSTTTVSVADIEAVIAALVSITPNVPYTVLVGFDTRTEDEDPNPIPYESPFAAYIYENPGLDVRIEQSGAYADGEWVENAFDREFYVPAVMLWFNSEGDITECQQLNESATYIRMKTRNTLDGFYIYLANGDEEFVSMETAMAGYDPDPGGANHTNWSLEVKVNAMAIRPFNTHPPVGTHETARHDGDASTTPPTAQEVCRIPIIRDGMRISAGGVYRENIYCAGSKGHNVELLGAG